MIGFVVSCVAMLLAFLAIIGLGYIKYRYPDKWNYEQLIIAGILFFGAMALISLIVMGAESHYNYMLNMEALRNR